MDALLLAALIDFATLRGGVFVCQTLLYWPPRGASQFEVSELFTDDGRMALLIEEQDPEPFKPERCILYITREAWEAWTREGPRA